MIVVLILTVFYQYLLNRAFSPLFQYLPITLEDDAVIRDEAFARLQGKKWGLTDGENERESEDINDALEAKERREQEQDKRDEEIELQEIEARKQGKSTGSKFTALMPGAISNYIPKKGSWANHSQNKRPAKWTNDTRLSISQQSVPQIQQPKFLRHRHRNHPKNHDHASDIEAQVSLPKRSSTAIGEALFSGLHDEIEDLTPDERDKLVQRAFQHEALRARRPVIWIPRDELGVSDDEIKRTRRAAGTNVWISNEFTGLDAKGRVVFGRSPPDFSEVDLIEL